MDEHNCVRCLWLSFSCSSVSVYTFCVSSLNKNIVDQLWGFSIDTWEINPLCGRGKAHLPRFWASCGDVSQTCDELPPSPIQSCVLFCEVDRRKRHLKKKKSLCVQLSVLLFMADSNRLHKHSAGQMTSPESSVATTRNRETYVQVRGCSDCQDIWSFKTIQTGFLAITFMRVCVCDDVRQTLNEYNRDE